MLATLDEPLERLTEPNAASAAVQLRHAPEGAVVSDEAAPGSSCRATKHAPQHDWLSLTGGAIGQACRSYRRGAGLP